VRVSQFAPHIRERDKKKEGLQRSGSERLTHHTRVVSVTVDSVQSTPVAHMKKSGLGMETKTENARECAAISDSA
jgi:hypothetical protein